MPQTQAFRGLRYDLARVGSLSDVIAPPYDVLDAELLDWLYRRSPHNVIRLEANRAEPNDPDSEAPYTRAANIFRGWKSEKILQYEPDPAIYFYTQTFLLDEIEFTRRGFLARVKLERFGQGKVFAHEQTHPKAKSDRLKLMRATEANLSPIFGLYPDERNEVADLLEECVAGVQGLMATDHHGVIHRVWPITDINVINKVCATVHSLPMFVADGHHRYETACDFRDELLAEGALGEQHPANYIMTALFGMSDPGLVILPTHRLLSGVASLTADEIRQRVASSFDCENYGHGIDRAAEYWKQMVELDDQGVMAIYSAASDQWLLLFPRPEAIEAMAGLEPNQSEVLRGLGVSLLHRLVLPELLQLRDIPTPTYVHSVDEVIKSVASKVAQATAFQLAVLVMPATIEAIEKVSLHSERMPAKSTYFYPKLSTGLIINNLS